MKKQIFVNLPVTNLNLSKTFYGTIGFTNSPDFTDDTAACMVLSDEIFVMLLTHEKFKEFTSKPIADTTQTVAAGYSLAYGSKEEVDAVVEVALSAGGSLAGEPKDYGFMYQRGFTDPDGHHWEAFYMDMTKMPQDQ